MSLDLTFKQVCTTVKKQGSADPKLLDAVDNLLGMALICSPGVLGPTAAALLPTLAAKNELVKIGKKVFDKFTKQKDEDYLLRHETMRTAYGLLVFTAFFDALDSRISEQLRKEIGLLDTEKAFIAKEAVRKTGAKKTEVAVASVHDAPVSTYIFPFPHPTETLAEQCHRQTKLWKQMGQGFVEFVQKLAFWDEADEEKQIILLAGLDKVEEEAARRFEAQYFELARKFEDFAVWANLHAHNNTKALLGEVSSYIRHHAKLSAASEKSIDIGFTKLREAVLSIPETSRIEQAAEIAESLNKHYQARVNEAIIEDKEIGDEDTPRLSFPKVSDAFVPQAFHVLRQAGKSRRLEDESTWNGLPRRNDLGAFLLSYLSSPYSTETPLLILGHPGSGKSLLTTVLSAQLMSNHFTAIRVPLREVNADADIVTQIEEAIRRITGVSFDSWIKLSVLFKNSPPLVILDGYDELLQASGQVFASYIKDAQRFQERETEQGRPLRVIITSRVTLIDKAAVPSGSTIVRLLEFDPHQREIWSRIWNKANVQYFRDAQIEKFALPDENEKGAEKILNLAQQPLLLLMLALYDSQGNQLRRSKGLDRTKLYDSLLRRFVIRERGKERGFRDTNTKGRDKAVSIEMQRLGVAAVGMYNRRKVHILSPELDDDLAFFKLEREVEAKSGKALSQADLLLGSFFFVHKSKAQHISGAEDTHEETAAFEFLHNTFGEFLTADFVLRRAVSQVLALRAAESNDALKSILDKMLGTADGFERDWFASLVYTPLFTRPVIMEMIREWTPHILREYALTEENFVETLDTIVVNQTRRLLNKREMPQIMRKETAQEGYRVPFGDHPLVGHIAIYSINLILLRLVAGRHPFIFDEGHVASHEDGTRPWDRLMHIWRAWFSLGNLNGLTAVMLADRDGSKITLTARRKFQAEEAQGKMQEYHNVALSLGDTVSAGITGVYLFDPAVDPKSDLDQWVKKLSVEGYDLGVPVAISQLLALGEHFPDAAEEFIGHARGTLEQALRRGRRDQVENVCLIISRIVGDWAITGSRRTLRALLDPRLVIEVALREPRSARILFNAVKHLYDFEWLDEVSGRFVDVLVHEMPHILRSGSPHGEPIQLLLLLKEIGGAGAMNRYRDPRTTRSDLFDRMLHPLALQELVERNPEQALAYFQILRELGVGPFVERNFDPDFFERMFHPGRLLELMEVNPEAALMYVHILRELGGARVLGRFMERSMDSEILQRILEPRRLLELSRHHPRGVLAWLQLLRELGGDGYFERAGEQRLSAELLGRVLSPNDVLELSEHNLEGALTYLEVLRQIRGGRYFEKFFERSAGARFLEHMLHSGHLLDLCERNPEGALAFLQLFEDIGAGRPFMQLVNRPVDTEFLERMFHVRYALDLSERNPEGALAYLHIIRAVSGAGGFGSLIEPNFGSELFDRMFSPSYLLELSDRRIRSFGFWLVFARLFNSPRITRFVGEAVSAGLRENLLFKRRLSTLPISSLVDLRWLSEQPGNSELKAFVAEAAFAVG